MPFWQIVLNVTVRKVRPSALLTGGLVPWEKVVVCWNARQILNQTGFCEGERSGGICWNAQLDYVEILDWPCLVRILGLQVLLSKWINSIMWKSFRVFQLQYSLHIVWTYRAHKTLKHTRERSPMSRLAWSLTCQKDNLWHIYKDQTSKEVVIWSMYHLSMMIVGYI